MSGDSPGLDTRLFSPVDIASLVYFRIVFGLIMLWESARFLTSDWIPRYYIDPIFHFTYYGFGWVKPWPGSWMYVHFVALGALALCITFGFFYRIATVLFFLAFTYIFLLEQSNYLNHFYLISLISFLMIFLPAHRLRSFDAWRRPSIRADFVPTWTLWLLRAQLGIVYFYAGVAKLNPDWLQGQPLGMWLADESDLPLVGPFLLESWCTLALSYGGLLLDLFIAPALLWPRTRPFAFGLALAFHLMNAVLFDIGIFPWFMIAATALFLRPDWPRRQHFLVPPVTDAPPAPPASLDPRQKLVLVLLGVYLGIQVLVPLRHFLYPGSVHWTEEGHRFAWHMKLRSKSTGRVRFLVSDPEQGKAWAVDPKDYLSPRQVRKMGGNPDLIIQFAHYLADEYRNQGHARVEVHMRGNTSLNGRRAQALVDPKVDLAREQRSLRHREWVLPLTVPLSDRR